MNAPSRECDYCGLPAGTGPSSGEPAYCCFGCRFAAAVTQARGEEGAANWALVCLGASVFLTMNVMVFTMALWTWDEEGAAGAPVVLRNLFRYLCLIFALPVLPLLGLPLLENALAALRERRITSDLLLVLGVAASYLYSAVAVVREQGPVYFEVGCAVLVLVTLGRWLEARGKLQTTAALHALHRLLPQTGRRLLAGSEAMVPLEELHLGDLLRVLPGERVPCDGRVLRQSATVDEQVLTGEAHPVVKEAGDSVLAGSLNIDSDLFVEMTRLATDSALARMIELVRRARQVKGHYERLADRVTAVFLPAVVVIALAAAGWHGVQSGAQEGILTGLAVVLIACPCALGLATPMAVWAALGHAALHQVLFRDTIALERLASVRAVRFDKTGTLTTGTPTVAAVFATNPTTVLGPAARIASSTTHPYARAIVRHAGADSPEPVQEVRTLPGLGLTGRLADLGSTLSLGSERLMEREGHTWPEDLARARDDTQGQSLVCFGNRGTVEALFVFREELRPEAAAAVEQLHKLGMNVAVLTGDNAGRGGALGRELGLSVQSALLPEDKVRAVQEARTEFGPVAMVGDGINDAAALAVSDVGIALGCGADVSRETAAVCLLGNDLRAVPWAIALAQRTVRVLRQNLFWAFAYNAIGVALACVGKLNPIIAATAMVVSSLLVVFNSLRLRVSAGDPTLHSTLPEPVPAGEVVS